MYFLSATGKFNKYGRCGTVLLLFFSKWQSRFVRQLQICDATWQANSYKLCTALGMVTQDLQRSASDSTRGTLPRQMDTQLKTSLICFKKNSLICLIRVGVEWNYGSNKLHTLIARV